MDIKKSSLNPYAPSYVPLSKRGKENESIPQINRGDFGRVGKSLPEIPKRWAKQTLDEDSEMDLAYLALTFPGVSDQSIADVYCANGGDVESSAEMLKQLEFPADFSQQFPDTLDIGDVEYGSSAEDNVVASNVILGETSGSSSAASKSVQ